MPKVETNTRKVIARLMREGWRTEGGGSHDKYTHPAFPKIIIIVPRHADLSPGVARQIAKTAGW